MSKVAHNYSARKCSRLAQIAFLLATTCIFLALSYSRLMGDAHSAAFRTKIIDAALAQPIWGSTLGNNLLLFAGIQFALHLSLVMVCWLLALLTKKAWPGRRESIYALTLAWLCLLGGWILTANAAWFPASSLGAPYSHIVRKSLFGLTFLDAYTTGVLALIVVLCWRISKLAPRKPKIGNLPRGILASAIAALLLSALVIDGNSASSVVTDPTKPHVILIGIDSLRADAVNRGGASITPSIDAFLAEAVYFSDVTTPLARTFPAWVSIITGRHPHTTGAIMNLLPREMIQTGETLPTIFSREGYDSIYAIDEVRFSNLDLSYGFDRMIAPPIGASDFFLGFFSDAPLSNVVVNTWLGKLLYPYTHANRAAAPTYDPDSFIRRLKSELTFDRPTLFALHLTLVHWPYTWAGVDTRQGDTAQPEYESAVARVDEQFNDVISLLRDKGALDNAIVVLLSDHGESLGQIHPPPRTQNLHHLPEHEEGRLVGHGTSVFAPSQYRVVLAMRGYGEAAALIPGPRIVDDMASLEDIVPTLSELLNLPPTEATDGVSLVQTLFSTGDTQSASPTRIRFTETEFNPQGIVPGQIIPGSALANAAAFYEVDPVSDRVSVRREKLNELLHGRQYAAFDGTYLLAAVPTTDAYGRKSYQALYVRDGSEPTHVNDPQLHVDPNVRKLFLALSTRFPHLATEAFAPTN